MGEGCNDCNEFPWRQKSPTFFELEEYVSQVMSHKDLPKIEDRERSTLLETLKQIKETEPDIYAKNRVYANIYCYLLLRQYLKTDDEDILDEFHENISSENGDLIALQLLIEACEVTELERREELENRVQNWSVQNEAVATAEVAFYLSRLDYRLYYPAIKMLEESLSKLPEQDQIFWKYQLGQMYHKMLNKDFWRKVENLDLRQVFQRLHELLHEVCLSNDSLAARAMVDLADAIENCKDLDQCKHLLLKIEVHTITQLSPSKLRTDALRAIRNDKLRAIRDDPHVKERYARSIRKLRDEETHLEEAIELLKEITDNVHTKRHVALHQQGIACRHLWLQTNNLQQRRSHKPKKRKKNSVPLADVAEAHGCRVHFDVRKLRSYNPVKTDKTERNELLEQARDCLQRATKIMNDRCAIYLIDLAKVHMSLGELNSADKCLDKACRPEARTRISDLDRAVLYEQLGILHYQLEQRKRTWKETKQYLRFAIEKTEATRKKPYDAFLLLQAMLNEDLQEASAAEKENINLEHQFITECIGNLQESSHYLEKVPNCKNKLQRLVRLLEKQSKHSDAYSEMYAGCVSGVLCLQEHASHLVQLACKAARERESTAALGDVTIYTDVFNLLFKDKTKHSNNSCDNGTNDRAVVLHNNFVLLVDDGDCDVVLRLCKVLEQCEFSVYIVSERGWNDLTAGANIMTEPIEVILHGDIVLGYMPQMCMLPTRWLHTTVTNIVQEQSKDRLIRIVDDSTNYPCDLAAISSVSIPALSRESENGERVQDEKPRVHDIMPVLLEAIVKKLAAEH